MPPVTRPTNTPLRSRIASLGRLLALIAPVPQEWLAERPAQRNRATGAELECQPCHSYRDLIMAWRKAMAWGDGLDTSLSVMLASVTSTKAVGDQLWVKVIGPASCGKSTLCEAISMNKRFVFAKSTLRGFHSGCKTDSDGEEDHSLIAQVADKTFVIKDGDTLLQSPNLGQILSEARDLYDRTSRSHYRHGLSRDYAGISMTWILCGTASLRAIDSSELGERFLDCVIMDGIDDDAEDEILLRVANRVDRNMAVEMSGSAETNYEPELAQAMQMTGGYVDYLRVNAAMLLSQVHLPEPAMLRIARLGKFVAHMRARPSKVQDESSEREFAARLVSQHIRLAKCLAVVLNRRTVDAEVVRRVTKVAMDTSRGHTLSIVQRLYRRRIGIDSKALAIETNKTIDGTHKMIAFLRNIKVVELNQVKIAGARTKQNLWKLTDRMRKLCDDVFKEEKN